MLSLRAGVVLLLLAGAACAAGCGGAGQQDITKMLAANDVQTGWFDKGVENGMNKLVPTVMLTLKNVSNEPVSLVQVNAVIRRAGETEEWGGAFVRAVGSEGLPQGASTKPIVLRSQLGYTGTEARAQMLQNKQFVDVRVQIFLKHGGEQWVKLGEWPVSRQLLVP